MATFITPYNKVPYDEIGLPHPQISKTAEGTVITRIYEVPGASVTAFMTDMLGFSFLKGPNNAPTGISRNPPQQDPSNVQLWATECNLLEIAEGPPFQDAVTKAVQYESMKVAVVYRTLNPRWEPLPDRAGKQQLSELWRYVVRNSESFEAVATSTPTGTGGFRFKGTTDLVKEPPAKLTAGGSVQYIWKQIPLVFDMDFNAWRLPTGLRNNIHETVGKINSETFDNVYPAKTLYCGSPDIQYVDMADERPAANIVYNFSRRGFDDPSDPTKSKEPLWDRVLKVQADGTFLYHQIETNNASPDAPYESVSFEDNLFRLD